MAEDGISMPKTTLRVELLTHTPEPLSLIYAAFRQCYHSGFVADMWPRLLSGEIAREKQAQFVASVMESGHASPVEHVSFTFAAEGVSRALTHQLVRHRIASYSQQSQRYVDGSNFDYVLPPAIARNPQALARFERCMAEIGDAYRDIKALLEADGRAGAKSNEDARFVLPQAAETRIVLTMNCRSLLNFFEHRCCMRAQWEIRAMADAMLALCRGALPELFAVAGAKCERLGYCPEGERFTCGRYPLRQPG
jgi:thymidylate synthase (FAD)